MEMEKFYLNPTLISLYLLLFPLFTIFNLRSCSSTSPQLISNNPLQDIACALVYCGEGTCNGSNESVLGFECQCNPGWKKIQIGPLTFPSCVIPNCTIDLQCGNGSPPPPPSAPLLPPSLNFSDPCALIWCGEGSCVSNGTGHTCQCFQDSANLFNNTALACFKQCSLGADCHGLSFGLPMPSSSPPPPPPPSTPPPPSKSSSPENASSDHDMAPTPASKSKSSQLRALTMLLLPASMLTWF